MCVCLVLGCIHMQFMRLCVESYMLRKLCVYVLVVYVCIVGLGVVKRRGTGVTPRTVSTWKQAWRVVPCICFKLWLCTFDSRILLAIARQSNSQAIMAFARSDGHEHWASIHHTTAENNMVDAPSYLPRPFRVVDDEVRWRRIESIRRFVVFRSFSILPRILRAVERFENKKDRVAADGV